VAAAEQHRRHRPGAVDQDDGRGIAWPPIGVALLAARTA